MTEWEFRWIWCETCNCAAVICPKCGNNCCNGSYGPAEWGNDGLGHRVYTSRHCTVCPLAYQYQRDAPTPSEEDIKAMEEAEAAKALAEDRPVKR